MTELWLVRHGESTWNAAGRMQGQTASPELTERGHRQALEAGAQLRGRVVERLLTSDLVRAQQTAAIIGSTLRLEPEVEPLLRERHYGSWQGRDSAEAIRATRSLPDQEPVPGGESLLEVRKRWATLLAALRGVRGPVVVVTHGTLIVEVAGGPLPRNGSVTQLMLSEVTSPLTPPDCSSPYPGSASTRTR